MGKAQAWRQDSVTGWGGAEINFGGHGDTKSLFEYESNEKGEAKKKWSLSQNFHKFWLSSQKFLQFSTNSKMKTKNKKEKKVFVSKLK